MPAMRALFVVFLAGVAGCSGATPAVIECIGTAVDDPNGQKNESWAKQIDCTSAVCSPKAICSPWKTSGYLEVTAGISACPSGDCTCANCNCERIPKRLTVQYYGDYQKLPACMALAPATGQDWVLTQEGCMVKLSQHLPTGAPGPVLGPFLLERVEAHRYKLQFSRITEHTSPDGFGVSHKTSETKQSYVMNFDNEKGTMVGSLGQTFTDFAGNNTETVATCGLAGVP